MMTIFHAFLLLCGGKSAFFPFSGCIVTNLPSVSDRLTPAWYRIRFGQKPVRYTSWQTLSGSCFGVSGTW